MVELKGRWRRFRSLILFCVSGVLALLIDIGVLYVLKRMLGIYVGRACSFLCAATFTWLFNRSITFERRSQASMGAEYVTYLSSMTIGGAINYAAYAISVQSVSAIHAQPAWGVALGSLAGLTFNFLSARRIIQGKT